MEQAFSVLISPMRLLERGYQVLCVDNFFTGTRRNIEHLLDHKRFELLRHDITHPLFVEVDQDLQSRLPGIADPLPKGPRSDHEDERDRGHQHAWSRKAFEDQNSPSVDERGIRRPRGSPARRNLLGERQPNRSTLLLRRRKRCAETLFFDYWRQHRIAIKVARIFNTYGPRTHPNDGRVVSSFIVQALADQDITLFGDGEQTRSFCYVDDLIRGLISPLMQTDDVVGPVNLGNPIEFTHARASRSD